MNNRENYNTDDGSKIKIINDKSFSNISKYNWVNIEVNNERVGKARFNKIDEKLVINSITIFPEYERKGYARAVIKEFKRENKIVIADRVRNTAKGFWEKMGFCCMASGDYIWKLEEYTR